MIDRLRDHLRHHSFFSLVQIIAVSTAFYWWRHLPVPGYAIGVLAVLAAVMSVHSEVRLWQKATWILLMGAFLVLEFRAIEKDRDEYAKAEHSRRIEENDQFQNIAHGLTAAIQQSQVQFAATMSRFDATTSRMESILQKEERTAELAKQNLDQTTGGDGYVYLLVAPRGPLNPPPDKWPLVIMNSADIPISDVSVFITEIPSLGDSPEERLKKIIFGVQLPTITTVRPLRQGGEVLSYSLDAKSYQAILRTRNNQFSETIRILPNSASPDGFAITYDVYRIGDGERKRLCCPSSLEFPSYYR